MENRPIELIAPTKRAFERMKDILFRPFDIQKWFILGFSAWLATLLESGSSSGSGGGGDTSDIESGDESISDFINEATSWVQEHLTIILVVGGIIALIIIAVGIVLNWVQSRGKMMFLDNVLNNRALISEPWKKFRYPANSLFWWTLIYGLIVGTAVCLLIGAGLFLAWPMIQAESFDPEMITPLVALAVALGLVLLAATYITMLLENFVIPLMHRDEIPATAAWKKVLSLHSSHPGRFILFFLWNFVLGIITAFAILLLVLGTCCIAAIPLIIPYIGTVLLLPVSVFFRLLGPEYLKQFGDEYDTTVETRESPPALPA